MDFGYHKKRNFIFVTFKWVTLSKMKMLTTFSYDFGTFSVVVVLLLSVIVRQVLFIVLYLINHHHVTRADSKVQLILKYKWDQHWNNNLLDAIISIDLWYQVSFMLQSTFKGNNFFSIWIGQIHRESFPKLVI